MSLNPPPMKEPKSPQDWTSLLRAIYQLFSLLQRVHTGSGSPESVVTAPVGHIYLRDDGGANTTLYVKESGTGKTGWSAI